MNINQQRVTPKLRLLEFVRKHPSLHGWIKNDFRGWLLSVANGHPSSLRPLKFLLAIGLLDILAGVWIGWLA